MKQDEGPKKIGELFVLNKTQQKKPPAHEWQDFALRVIAELGVPSFKRNSVFQICKKNSKATVEKALNETKELCKTGESWKYFFKVIDSLKKSKESPEAKIKNQSLCI